MLIQDNTGKIIYQPLPKQDLFHESSAKYRAQIGGYGSGKTQALMMEAIQYCLACPGVNVLLLRRTSPDLQKTLISKFENPQLVPRSMYKLYNKNEKIVYFHNGSKLFFGYCQRDSDVNQFLSTEFAYIGVEEAGEFSFRVWEALCGRNRVPTTQLTIHGDPVRPSMGISTNPFGVGYSWIKTLFVDKKPIEGMDRYNPNEYFMVHSTVLDNPYTATPEYMAVLNNLTGSMKQKALYGNLNLISGQFFDNFDMDRHVVNRSDLVFKPWHPIWLGADWGMAHSFPVYWMTKAEMPDRIHGGNRVVNVIYKELIMRELNALEAADEIARNCHPVYDRDRIIRCEERPQQMFLSWERFIRHEENHTVAEQMGKQLAKYGLPKPARADKSRVDGWQLIYQLLDMDELVITTDCPRLIANLPLLTRDEKNLEDVQKSDTLADDIGDAVRYGLKSFLRPGKKPENIALQEKLDSIKDPYARQVYAFREYNKRQAGNKPIQVKRTLPWMQRS